MDPNIKDQRSYAYKWMESDASDVSRLDDLFSRGVYLPAREGLTGLHKTLTWSGFMMIGMGFITFLASNWYILPSLVKFGIFFGVVILSSALLIFRKWAIVVERSLGMLVMLLIGALYALYGQVYQTGADAYTLFMMWGISISPMVLLSRYSIPWIFWVGLMQLSFFLYVEQVGTGWGSKMVLLCFYGVNALWFVISYMVHRSGKLDLSGLMIWVSFSAALVSGLSLTLDSLFAHTWGTFSVALGLFLGLVGWSIWIDWQNRKVRFSPAGLFSLMIIFTSWMVDLVNDPWFSFFFIGIFFLLGTMAVVTKGVRIQRNWDLEKQKNHGDIL